MNDTALFFLAAAADKAAPTRPDLLPASCRGPRSRSGTSPPARL